MKDIVTLQLKETAKRFENRDYHISFTEELGKHLLDVGFDDMYGARPLKRIINELIVDEVALQIVEGKIKEKDKIKVDYKNNKIQIEKHSIN
jgi:ATP-dependent Clp protease ATP-binding subunit ClpA